MLGRDKFPFQPRIFFFFRPRTYPFNSRKTYCNRSNRPSLSCRTKFQTSLSLLFSHRSWKMPRHFAKTAHGRKVVPTFLGWTSQVFPHGWIFAILRFFIYPLLNPFSGLGFVSDLCSLLTLPAFFASFFAFFDSFCDRSFEGTALTPTIHGSEVNLHQQIGIASVKKVIDRIFNATTLPAAVGASNFCPYHRHLRDECWNTNVQLGGLEIYRIYIQFKPAILPIQFIPNKINFSICFIPKIFKSLRNSREPGPWVFNSPGPGSRRWFLAKRVLCKSHRMGLFFTEFVLFTFIHLSECHFTCRFTRL